VIGAAKVAAAKLGIDAAAYLAQRAAGLRWCSCCRAWAPVVHRGECSACRAARWRDERTHQRRADTGPPSTHPPVRWCSCEACRRERGAA
jgi:hypothetical protein